ncbi:MAG: hypothetical protein CSA13_01465 [Clostridiales bacterium]|nr:MAG: hypothetical protein CSA13_01465 [Clostridiales bacterium]
MRKILSLVLVLALVLGAFPAFADVDQYEVANKLKEYKVLLGNEAGDLMLDEYLTREQAMVVLARLMGVEEDAKNTTLQASFTDVDHAYYEPFIAYAELKGWTNGIGNGLFGYGKQLTVKEFAAYMLRVLGYDVEYDKVMEKAGELGLLKDVVTTDEAASILRGEMAVVMHNTLMTKPANNDMTLLNVLGLEGEVPTGDAMVKSVEAKNLKQLVVNFSAPLTEAGDEENYDLDTKGDAEIDKDSDFELSEDGMTVTITMTKPAEQQDKADLEIKGLLKEDVTIKDIQFLDVSIPEAKSASVIGVDTIKVEFSEPMKTASLVKTKNFTVETAKGSKLYVKKVTAKQNETVAWVELYSKLKEGDITLEVKDAEDYQGYSVKPAEFALTVVEDKEAPTIVGYKDADPYEITLIWSEDIEFVETDGTVLTNSEDLEAFYHTNTRDVAKRVEIDGNEMTLEFDKDSDDDFDTTLPSGTAYVYVDKKAVKDLWDNKNAMQVVTAEITKDEEAPVVKEIDVKSQVKIEVEFDEKVYEDDDFDWELLEKGKVESIDADITGWGTDTLTFVFDDDIEGDYTLVLKKIEDRTGNEASKISVDFTADDETSPVATDFKVTAYDIDKKIQKVVIRFDEEMDSKSITDKDDFFLTQSADTAYTLVDKTLDDDDVDFDVQDDGETLVIEIPEDYHNLTADALGFLKIGRLVDAAGNKMTTYSANLPIANGDAVALRHEAELKSVDEVEITIEDEVVEDLVDKKFEIMDASGKSLKFKSFSTKLDDGDTIISITLGDEVATDAQLTYKVMAGAGENKYGAKLKVGEFPVVDDAGPEMEKVYTENGAIVVEMSEQLSKRYESSIAHDFVIMYNSEKLIPVKEFTSSVVGNKVYLNGIAGKEDTIIAGEGKYKVKSVDKPGYLVDLMLNKAEPFTDYEKIKKIAGNGTTPNPNPNPNPGDEADVVKAQLSAATFGVFVKAEIVVNGQADYANATKYSVWMNGKKAAKAALLGEKTVAFPAPAAGDTVQIQLLTDAMEEVAVVDVVLTAE